ncbi:hypothetical protein [Polyangium jinanense]|uniref:Uncharacterized protein n=1 Tax=Polyangium jinanense TaxID=2829994 RepID=A0A9X3X651_9BACT|nr:hypothetical protein [Polyangium jinanense]MDC3960211.1 hypothetical protein [Polyangium jinanense]MDC3984927.1 hypothetical protein [Polyangium jinanense]
MAKEQPWPFDRGDAGAGQPRTQESVPGVRGGEPVSRGPLGDEGGAGSYPGGPTYSEGTTLEDGPNPETWVPPTEEISGPPMEPTD